MLIHSSPPSPQTHNLCCTNIRDSVCLNPPSVIGKRLVQVLIVNQHALEWLYYYIHFNQIFSRVCSKNMKQRNNFTKLTKIQRRKLHLLCAFMPPGGDMEVLQVHPAPHFKKKSLHIKGRYSSKLLDTLMNVHI